MTITENRVLQRPSPITTTTRVVVGSDGSYWGDAALNWAAGHAWVRGAELQVWQPADRSTIPTDVPGDIGLSHITTTFPLLHLRAGSLDGDPVARLVQASRTSDLLVLGYRGHTHSYLGLGSVVLPLLQATRCPTVVVRGHHAAVHGEHHRVTALVDGGDRDAAVLRHAAEMALTHRAKLRVAHALALPASRPELVETDAHSALAQAEAQLALLDRCPSTCLEVVRCHPYELVSRYTDTDRLVVGHGNPRGNQCGTITKAALHHAWCPVLVVR
ncbi:universal stress protein [Solihabitans fulvus]|nr:universal stress protein [Solihabitans fulvus]